MKSLHGLPTVQDFFQTYAKLSSAIRRSGFAAQVVSALTEIGGIYAAAYSALLPVFPSLAFYLAAAVALIGTAVIEVGLRVLTPHTVDAVLYRRFNGLYLPMTVAIWLCTALLLGTSGVISFANSKTIVAEYTPPAEQLATTAQDSAYLAEKSALAATFSQDSAMIAGRHESQIQAQKIAYAGKIQAKQTELRNLRRKEGRTGQSFATQKDNAAAAIAAIEAEKAAQLASLEASKAHELGEARKAYTAAAAWAKTGYAAKVDSIQAINRAAIDQRAETVSSYGGGLGYFTIVCLFIFCASVVLDRIHRKGSGIRETIELSQYDVSPPALAEALQAIRERFNYSLMSRIKAFADRTPPAPLPTQPTQLYDPTEVSNITIVLKVDQDANGGEIVMQPKRRPIGFSTQGQQGGSPSVSNAAGNAGPVNNGSVNNGTKLPPKICLHCGQEYPPKVSWQKFCSTQCKDAYHAGQHGGQSFDPAAYHKQKKGKK